MIFSTNNILKCSLCRVLISVSKLQNQTSSSRSCSSKSNTNTYTYIPSSSSASTSTHRIPISNVHSTVSEEKINSTTPDVHTQSKSTGGRTTVTVDFAASLPPSESELDIFQRFSWKVKNFKSPSVPIVHHDKYVCEFPVEHRFCMQKFLGVMGCLHHDSLIVHGQVVEPEEITKDLCELVHDPDYIHRFFYGLTSDKEQRISGFRWSPGIVSRCRHETGGTLLACQLALERGIACSSGGGTHHAFHSHGSGYCLINDMAVAAAAMIHNKVVDRVLIVDLDVHQGDGTASIMEHDHNIFTLSVHCQSNFPFKKQTSDLDIGLQDHVGDREYLETLEDCLPWVVDTFRPDLVIYDAGIDVHISDELGRLDLTDDGIFKRDSYVLNVMKGHGIPVATVIGGDYSRNLDVLSRRHTIVHRAAFQVWKENLL